MSMAKTEAEAVELLKKKLREDKIFGSLISKIGELTSTNPDLSVELSTLRVSNKNLNAKISGLETSKLETERNLAEETKARITSDGRILELEKQVRKLDETLAVYRQDKNTDEVSLKQWKRKTEDADERIKTLTEEKAKLVQDIGEVRKQYNDTLTQNLEFSKKLTSANEQILGIEKEKETLTEKLKSSKRLAKRIVAKV
jgi:chromosome segregation ATPase